MWNPYLPLSTKEKRISTIVSLVSILLLWSLLSGLKIIGPDSTVERGHIEESIKKLGLEYLVELYEFLPLDELEEIMKDCFCGINLITNAESYSSLAIPGKFIQYLQMKMPILATKNNGLVNVIEKNKLGIY